MGREIQNRRAAAIRMSTVIDAKASLDNLVAFEVAVSEMCRGTRWRAAFCTFLN